MATDEEGRRMLDRVERMTWTATFDEAKMEAMMEVQAEITDEGKEE